MKRILWIILCLFMPLLVSAQTQQGVVKTRGRMENGVLQPGVGLQGATVQVEDRQAVVSGANGKFSFPLHANTYLLKSVKKQGYELMDMEVCRRYNYSPNPLYLIMDTPAQLRNDRLAAERKIRRDLQRRLQEREDEIEALQASQEEKDSLLQALYLQQTDNEKLIADMAQRYSMLDYDQLDEFYRQVAYFIENGELTRADSLLRLRGDVNSQVTEQLHKQEVVQQKKRELAQAEATLHAENEELARRCMSYYDSFCMQHQNDSAAHYIDLRAALDTTRVEWQFEAANYHTRQHTTSKAERYYKRILAMIADMPEDGKRSVLPAKAATLNNMGLLYEQTQQIEQALACYLESHSIREQLSKENPEVFLPLVAQTKTNLGALYTATGRMNAGEEILSEALNILEELTAREPQKYLSAMAATQSSLGTIYMRFDGEETQALAQQLLRNALTAYRQLAQDEPLRYEPDVAATLSNLALLYFRSDQLAENRSCYDEALTLYARLAQDNPQAYLPHLNGLVENMRRMALELNNKGFAADNDLKPQQGKGYYEASLDIYRRLATLQTNDYSSYVARELGNLSFNAILMKAFAQAEDYARQGLAADPAKLFIYANLAEALLLQGKQQEAEAIVSQRADQLRASLLDDLEKLEQRGVIGSDRQDAVRRIREMLKVNH